MPTVSSRRGRRRSASLTEGPDPIDIHVGARVKLRRTLLGLSQSDLGQLIGLTFQQIQKYERASNRISASMLHHIAEALDVPVSFFFDDMADGLRRSSPTGDDRMTRRESLELMRHYHSIPKELRHSVYDLIKAMARNGV